LHDFHQTVDGFNFDRKKPALLKEEVKFIIQWKQWQLKAPFDLRAEQAWY